MIIQPKDRWGRRDINNKKLRKEHSREPGQIQGIVNVCSYLSLYIVARHKDHRQAF